MSRYRGRRRSVSPLMLLIALVVAIAAVVLIVINLGKDKTPANDDANTPPAAGDTTDPGTADDPNAADPVTPDVTEPAYQKIELKGDQQQYDAVYRVGDTGYEMYSYVDSTAKKYADNVNAVADALAGKANVYMLPIPLSSGISLPDELYGKDIFAENRNRNRLRRIRSEIFAGRTCRRGLSGISVRSDLRRRNSYGRRRFRLCSRRVRSSGYGRNVQNRGGGRI